MRPGVARPGVGSNILTHERFAKGPGGPGDGMDARIAKLESQMEAVQSSLRALDATATKLDDRLRSTEIAMSALSERVAHLPSKGFIITVVLSAAAVVSGVSIYLETIRSALGVGS